MFLSRFFEPKPYNSGYLPEQDGHRVYFAEYGNSAGEVILVTHGGPGGSCKPHHAKCYDLKKYRVIMMDQRGCGKSLPNGKTEDNNTMLLVDDLKRLLDYLNIINKVIVRGASWGATLALLFAEKYPECVDKLLLSQIFLANEESRLWAEKEIVKMYPDLWEEIKKPARKNQSVPECYWQLLRSRDEQKQKKALMLYGSYERLLGELEPKFTPVDEISEKELNSLKIYANYARNQYFMSDNQILHSLKRIANIPTLIVHNRQDFLCPLSGAYRLHKRMPKSTLVIVPDKGHVSKLLHKTIKLAIRRFLSAT